VDFEVIVWRDLLQTCPEFYVVPARGSGLHVVMTLSLPEAEFRQAPIFPPSKIISVTCERRLCQLCPSKGNLKRYSNARFNL
jgi:hypothetical protein